LTCDLGRPWAPRTQFKGCKKKVPFWGPLGQDAFGYARDRAFLAFNARAGGLGLVRSPRATEPAEWLVKRRTGPSSHRFQVRPRNPGQNRRATAEKKAHCGIFPIRPAATGLPIKRFPGLDHLTRLRQDQGPYRSAPFCRGEHCRRGGCGCFLTAFNRPRPEGFRSVSAEIVSTVKMVPLVKQTSPPGFRIRAGSWR